MRQSRFRSRVATVLGLVLVAAVMFAVVLVPPIGLAQLTLLAFFVPIVSSPLTRAPARVRVSGSPRPPCEPRAPPLS